MTPYEGEGRWREMELLLLVTTIALVGALAAAFGPDSRDGNDWAWHRRA